MSDKLPSRKELAKLPPRLIVAYAARAAQRVFPFAQRFYDAKELQSVVEAIALAVAAGSLEYTNPNLDALASSANKVQDAIDSTDYDGRLNSDTAYYAASSAVAAADTAVHADRAENGERLADEYVGETATYVAAEYAAKAALSAYRGASNSVSIQSALLADYQFLLKLSETSDHLNVDLPLWPDGVPDWYESPELLKEHSVRETKPKSMKGLEAATEHEEGIHLYLDPGNASAETIQGVLDAISEYHIAAGGFGLEYIVDGNSIVVVEGSTR